MRPLLVPFIVALTAVSAQAEPQISVRSLPAEIAGVTVRQYLDVSPSGKRILFAGRSQAASCGIFEADIGATSVRELRFARDEPALCKPVEGRISDDGAAAIWAQFDQLRVWTVSPAGARGSRVFQDSVDEANAVCGVDKNGFVVVARENAEFAAVSPDGKERRIPGTRGFSHCVVDRIGSGGIVYWSEEDPAKAAFSQSLGSPPLTIDLAKNEKIAGLYDSKVFISENTGFRVRKLGEPSEKKQLAILDARNDSQLIDTRGTATSLSCLVPASLDIAGAAARQVGLTTLLIASSKGSEAALAVFQADVPLSDLVRTCSKMEIVSLSGCHSAGTGATFTLALDPGADTCSVRFAMDKGATLETTSRRGDRTTNTVNATGEIEVPLKAGEYEMLASAEGLRGIRQKIAVYAGR